jgi:CMP-N,N'-diacetyllegionaminic acid synthase
MNIIALIPAKKKSIGLVNKNLKKINSKSLVENTILCALKSKLINHIFLTSDSNKILEIGKKYKINLIKRPKSLCSDITTANKVIEHSLKIIKKKFIDINKSIIVYLQPTSPLRTSLHLNKSIKIFLSSKEKTILLSAYEEKNFFKSLIKKKKYFQPFFKNSNIAENRQKFKKIFLPNGAIYIFQHREFLKYKKLNFSKSILYEMKKTESIDIDNYNDYCLAKLIMMNSRQKN